MGQVGTLQSRVREFQWERGLRAGVAVGSAMVVTHEFGRPFGWAAFGAFMAILVDNGGSYRTRLITMATTLGGGALAGMLGSLIGSGTLLPSWIGAIMLATAVVCFVVTYARVLAQPMASTSVMVLVTYFAGLGGSQHTFAAARAGAGMLLLGGLWATGLSLALWPLDPFRPARLAVAMCYASLAEFTLGLGQSSLSDDLERVEQEAQAWKRKQRIWIEEAQAALVATPARAPTRTVRARNLTVLLETADMLYATTMRLTELAELAGSAGTGSAGTWLGDTAQLLGQAERAIGASLQHRPVDGAASFAVGGSHRLDLERRRQKARASGASAAGSLEQHLAREEQDATLELEVCFEAVRGLWNGVDAQATRAATAVREGDGGSGWLDEVKANWTLKSVMMRHALRLAVVGAVDVGLMHIIQLNHGYWLAMTSIIVMQPGGLGTVRKGMQRVGGTVAGGILAAGLAASIHSQTEIIAVIVITATLTLATYAIDYGLYCFFLTPTFVLMSLPHLRDWHYAGIRMGTTVVGALVALVAMRLLWHEHAMPELSRLLSRGAAANAAYLRAVRDFWALPATLRREGQRTLLGPARRSCGLASNETEEALDRMMLEPGGWREWGKVKEGERNAKEQALRYATYLRRLTQSATTVAMLGRGTRSSVQRVELLAVRLEGLASRLLLGRTAAVDDERRVAGPVIVDVAEDQMQRMERQVGVLERAAAALAGVEAVPSAAEAIVVG